MTAAFGNSYGYDANGNQTTRTIGGVTYTFTYDYENHLTAVSGGSISASFVYDADGNRVKGTVNGTTTVYLAGLYEYQSGATTLYYEGNALRRTGYATDNGVFYLLQDQLKSSSALINQNGTVNSRNYFDPFGGNRGGAAFSALTTKRFTGQYHEAGLPGGEGLSYYGARWYDAQLGRFASPDTIVPGPTNPQTFNRYAYTLNNPLSYTDSTGHSVDGPGVGSYDYSGSYSSTCNTWTGCNATTPLVQSCAYNACRDRDVSTTIRFYANTYGIPEHLLGATMMTEAIDDQQWKGSAADFVNSIGVGMYMVGKRGLSQPSMGTESLAMSYTIGSGILWGMDKIERWHGSPGVGANNIHIDTARGTETYFQEKYPNTAMAALVRPGRPTPEVLDSLFSTDGNIRYAAAYLRQLADLRTQQAGPHLDLTDNEMAIIYGAYRSGPESYDGDKAGDYQHRQVIGQTHGPTFLKFLQLYRER